MQLEAGQVAVVTGGASGLGLALVEAFAARGLSIVVADVERDPLAGTVAHLEQRGVPALGVPTDVRHAAQVDALAAAAIDRFGRVDVIVNNAGVSALGPYTWETPANDWEWVLSVNLHGVINGIRAFVPHLVAQNSGHVVNTSSMAGITATTRQAPYTAAKWAVAGISEALRAELGTPAPNVGVTIVYPGMVATNIHHAGRNRPESLAGKEFDFGGPAMDEIMEWAGQISKPEMMTSEDAADIVVRAVEANQLHFAPNGAVGAVRARVDRLLASFDE